MIKDRHAHCTSNILGTGRSLTASINHEYSCDFSRTSTRLTICFEMSLEIKDGAIRAGHISNCISHILLLLGTMTSRCTETMTRLLILVSSVLLTSQASTVLQPQDMINSTMFNVDVMQALVSNQTSSQRMLYSSNQLSVPLMISGAGNRE